MPCEPSRGCGSEFFNKVLCRTMAARVQATMDFRPLRPFRLPTSF